MKIQAYKSNSGKLFETAKECEIENLKDSIIDYLKTEYTYYDQMRYYRETVVEEIATAIVNDKSGFIKLLNGV